MLWRVFGASHGILFGPIGGALGDSFGVLVAFRWLTEILTRFLWAPWSPQGGPQGALDSPQQRSRRPHREAESLAKPPRPLRRRLSANPLTILKNKIKEKSKQDPWPRHPRGDFGAVNFSDFVFHIFS